MTTLGKKLPKNLETRRKISDALKGKHPTEETRQEISKSSKKHWKDPNYRKSVIEGVKASWDSERRKQTSERSKKCWQDPEYRKKVIEGVKRSQPQRIEKIKGRKLSEEHKKNIGKSGRRVIKIRDRIHEREVYRTTEDLSSKGFRCIPVGRTSGGPIPDIIAIKDGKVYAVEVEFGDPDFKKYEGVALYDDIWWISKELSEDDKKLLLGGGEKER